MCGVVCVCGMFVCDEDVCVKFYNCGGVLLMLCEGGVMCEGDGVCEGEKCLVELK